MTGDERPTTNTMWVPIWMDDARRRIIFYVICDYEVDGPSKTVFMSQDYAVALGYFEARQHSNRLPFVWGQKMITLYEHVWTKDSGAVTVTEIASKLKLPED